LVAIFFNKFIIGGAKWQKYFIVLSVEKLRYLSQWAVALAEIVVVWECQLIPHTAMNASIS